MSHMSPLTWRFGFARIYVYFSQVLILSFHLPRLSFLFLNKNSYETKQHKSTKSGEGIFFFLGGGGGPKTPNNKSPGEREFGQGTLFDARYVSFGQVPWI